MKLSRMILVSAIFALLVPALVLLSPTIALANLPPSPFEGGDGNLSVDTPGLQDWVNVPNRVVGVVNPSGKKNLTFAGGATEDTLAAAVVTGVAPVVDLTRFYAAHQLVAGSQFLYVAWERAKPGDAIHLSYEFNQSSVTISNAKTPARTDGDLLITFDYAKPVVTPTLGLSRWLTTSPGPCEVTGTLPPCWGQRVDLTANGWAEAAVNQVAVRDPMARVNLAPQTFGEASINLTAAGVFNDRCLNLASVMVKSRGQFILAAPVQDLIPPVDFKLQTCATLNLRKTDNANPPRPLSGAVFTLFKDVAPLAGSDRGAEDVLTRYTCTTNTRGECSILQVQPAPYWVVETTPPPGYTPAPAQNVILLPGVTTKLVFTDTGKPSALTVRVQDDDKPANPLNRVGVALFASAAVTTATCTTDAMGTCTISDVPAGVYTLKQTTTLAGYTPPPDQKVILAGQPVTATLTDKRQFRVIILVCQESNNQLYASNVRTDNVVKVSLGAGDAALLCGLGGASFDDQTVGKNVFEVNIPE